jgi:hypothetical protein
MTTLGENTGASPFKIAEIKSKLHEIKQKRTLPNKYGDHTFNVETSKDLSQNLVIKKPIFKPIQIDETDETTTSFEKSK